MIDLTPPAQLAKAAARKLARLSPTEKNRLLHAAADDLLAQAPIILAENEKDVAAARLSGVKSAFIDRLTLTETRLCAMADAIRAVAALPDPLGEYAAARTLPNGLTLAQKRVPLGVVGVIFESRPNVSADAFAICFKAGNAVILRGGKEAVRTNAAIVGVIRSALAGQGFDENAVYCVADTSRETANAMMRLNDYIDVLVPRGGAGLIQSVVENSTIPVIQTGVGNCHIFVDETADFDMAVRIIVNAKTQRPGVCNAAEKLLIHAAVANEFLPIAANALRDKNVELRGDEAARKIDPTLIPAVEEDWRTEYEDLIMAVAVVPNLEAAIDHITAYTTHHSEAIITQNVQNATRFTNEIDAAAVYVNASTRFTDGGEFGLGAEIGISTQKLHARGPMGVREMTTTKYIILGDGHVRP